MALISCPECKSKISDKAVACPKCGYELNSNSGSSNKIPNNNSGKGVPKSYIIIGILLIIIGTLYFYNGTEKVTKVTEGGKTEKTNNTYNSYTSDYLKISFNYPKDYNVVTDDNGFIYIAAKLQDKNAAFPYVMIGRFDDYTSAISFINDFTPYMQKQYSDLTTVTNVLTGNIGNKTVYGITYNYKINDYLIVDNRYAFLVNNKVYMVATREVNENSETINTIANEVIKSLMEVS